VAAADADPSEVCEHLRYGSGLHCPEHTSPMAKPVAGGEGGCYNKLSQARSMLLPPSPACAMTVQPPNPLPFMEARHLLLCFTAD